MIGTAPTTIDSAAQRWSAETSAFCLTCDELVPATYVVGPTAVMLVRTCPSCGPSSAVVSGDPSYWLRCQQLPIMARPHARPKPVMLGCPYDCGVCEAHATRMSGVIIEIIDGCNMKCPMCIAASLPGLHGARTSAEFGLALAQLDKRTRPSVLMLSGGEPTIHPQFFGLLDAGLAAEAVDRVFVITNGRRVADDAEFVRDLALRENVEVYLQFDSLTAGSLVNLRGEDLVAQRRSALDRLAEAGIPTTLVCVSKAGVTLAEAADLTAFAYDQPNVRGITFQPIREVGRLEGYSAAEHQTDLSDVRRALIARGDTSDDNLAPHPISPNGITVGYLWKGAGSVEQATAATNEVYSRFPGAREQLFALPPAVPFSEYDRLFRIAIVEYLDRRNFSTVAASEATIGFADQRFGVVPVDTYYAFYAEDDPAQVAVS